MRYIHRNGTPPQELIDNAHAVSKLLEGAATHDERKNIIDQKRKAYRDFHDWLLKQSYGKCWFSDTDSLFQHFDVEHYRPKKESKNLEGQVRDGYWWLAFDWENLRICGNVGNRMKGPYFPLHDEKSAATAQKRHTREEIPMLLDPADQRDASVVHFDEQGEIVPLPDSSNLDKIRLQISIKRYKLDFERLVEGRRRAWWDCQRLINLCQNQMKEFGETESPAVLDQIKTTMSLLADLVNYKKRPLTSVAVACLLASGFKWAARVATTEPAHEAAH